MKFASLLMAGAAALALASCGNKTQVTAPLGPITIAQVDGAAIEAADQRPGVWLSHGRTYSEQRYSPLSKINTGNVAQVGLAWTTTLDANRGMEATPIVVDGVMYVTSAWSIVYALDAKTGKKLWTKNPGVDKARGQKACCDVVNRGVAIWKGKVYVGTIDGRLIAYDAKTGDVKWEKLTVDQSKPYTITGAPRVVKGKVIIGNGGAELGVRGYITAYDAETGEQAWRFFTTPNPEKKADGAASDKFWADKGNATWGDEGEWKEAGGGGTAWDGMAYDPKLNLFYVGVGNGSPWNQRLRDPAGKDNLLLSSILAINPDTGEYKWHYQTTPGETWDYTATQPLILADIKLGNDVRKVIMQAPKNGFFYVIDRETGKLISGDKYQNDISWAERIDENGRPVETKNARYEGGPQPTIPGPLGAHNWHPMAFSPDTGLVYIPAHTLPSLYADEVEHKFRPGFWNTGTEFAGEGKAPTLNERAAQRAALKGQLVAWDPAARKARWVHDYPTPWNGGILATAGGLVFQGSLDGKFRAFDAAKGGAPLWETDAQYPVMSGPMSYEIDGEQYIAVTAGWGTALPVTGGGDVIPKIGTPENGRVVVYKLGATAKLDEYLVAETEHTPAAADFGSAAQLANGRVLYDRNCMVCHGPNVVSSGVIQDLRWAEAPGAKKLFAEVVLDGKYASAGMGSFAGTLTPANAESIRAYIINRAHEDADMEKAAAKTSPK